MNVLGQSSGWKHGKAHKKGRMIFHLLDVKRQSQSLRLYCFCFPTNYLEITLRSLSAYIQYKPKAVWTCCKAEFLPLSKLVPKKVLKKKSQKSIIFLLVNISNEKSLRECWKPMANIHFRYYKWYCLIYLPMFPKTNSIKLAAHSSSDGETRMKNGFT